MEEGECTWNPEKVETDKPLTCLHLNSFQVGPKLPMRISEIFVFQNEEPCHRVISKVMRCFSQGYSLDRLWTPEKESFKKCFQGVLRLKLGIFFLMKQSRMALIDSWPSKSARTLNRRTSAPYDFNLYWRSSCYIQSKACMVSTERRWMSCPWDMSLNHSWYCDIRQSWFDHFLRKPYYVSAIIRWDSRYW